MAFKQKVSSWEQTTQPPKKRRTSLSKERSLRSGQSRKRVPPPQKRRRVTVGRVLAYIALAILALILIGLATFAVVLYSIPVPEAKNLSFSFSESSQIIDRNGALIATYSPAEKRVYKPLAEISPLLQQAIIAVEDHRFYEHYGIDVNGLARAVWDYATTGQVQGGGSTLTQQLAREAYLTKEVNLIRKFKEIMLAFRIEQAYSKEQILELYLNAVYYGQNAYGAEAAALTYFGKHASELNLAEAAWLAGVINVPSVLGSPDNRDAAKERQELVLNRMKTYRMINEGEYDQAVATELIFSESAIRLESDAPYFVTWVRGILEEKYPSEVLLKGGLTIQTSLDLQMQRWANEAITEAYRYWTEDQGELDPTIKDDEGVSQPQGALVALDPKTGDVLAMTGGRDWNETEVNRVLRARQPGSAFKIFDYTAAIDKKIINPATRLVSEEIDLNGWKPNEYTGVAEGGSASYAGEMTVREAVKKSSNVIAIKVALQVGLDNVIAYAHKMGITAELPPYPSIAIGGVEVTPLEMAQAYAVLANMGSSVQANPIRKITDREGTVLEDNPPLLTQVLSPATSYVMTDLFKGVYQNTGYAVVDGLIAAAKTGTTDEFKDAWFCGYTPNIVAVARNGNDYDYVPFKMKNIGAWIPATIWHDFMVKIATIQPSEDWPMPPGVIRKDGEVYLVGTENMVTVTPSTPTVNITATPSWIPTQTPSWLLPPPSPSPTPTPSPSPSPTPTMPPIPTSSPSFFPTPKPTPTPTPTTPTPRPSPSPSPTPLPTPTKPPITETPSWLL